MFAARNITLCTKDCACLMVCPTGATDTENGQIDKTACLDGCRLCVDACPSHAIYLVPTKTGFRPGPTGDSAEALDRILSLTAEIHHRAASAPQTSELEARFLKALAHSTRVLAEDCWRERGYLSIHSAPIESFMTSHEVLAAYTDAGGAEAALGMETETIVTAVNGGKDLEEES